MSISIRARRTAIVSFAIALIAASCALPEYEVGESSSGTTATGSTATAGGSQTSSSTGGAGGAGGAGGEGQGGAGGGEGGAGGSSMPGCPETPPTPDSKCMFPMLKCFYPSATDGKSCCDDEYKCFGNDPATATWLFIPTAICPPAECPQDCSPVCPPEPPPALGCPCRVEMPLLCNYNGCATNQTVQQMGCSPPANPGGKSIWMNKGAHQCCMPGGANQCPGCATHEDVNNQPVSFCP